MKKYSLTALLGLMVCLQVIAQKPQTFILKGKLSGKPVDSVQVSYPSQEGPYKRTVVPVKDQSFTFSAPITQPIRVYLVIQRKGEVIKSPKVMDERTRQFYAEPGVVTLTGDPENMAKMKFTGSKTQAEFDELNAQIKPIRDEMQPLIELLDKEKDHEKQAEIHEKFQPFQDRIKKVNYDFFIKHPNSYVTLDMMRVYVSNMKLDSVKRIYNGFSETFKNTSQGKELAGEIKKIEGGMPGSVAPLFTKTDIDGKTLSLADFKGRYVMLDFWASWCVPCRKGNPHMIEVYKKYKSKGLEIIGIADDDRALKAWHDAIEKDGVGIWRHILRGLNMDMIMKRQPNPDDLDQAYGIASIPTKILIDPQGKIIGRFGDTFGGSDEDMDKMLAEVLK